MPPKVSICSVKPMTKNRSSHAEVDVQLGIRHCDGREDIYCQILEHYYAQYITLPALADLQRQSQNDTVRWLHTLRGHSATIGAVGLSTQARELQHVWYDLTQLELKQRWQQLIAHIQQVTAEANQYIQLYRTSH